jgi:SAM-dependent methyltransferase
MRLRQFVKNLFSLPGLHHAVSLPAQPSAFALLQRTTPSGRPNINPLGLVTHDLHALRLSVKALGYRVAREMATVLPNKDISGEPRVHDLGSRASTQADIETPWFVYWCRLLQVPPLYHRKLWEFAWALQCLHEAGMLQAGKRGIGFGCGEEPLPSYLASIGVDSVATDLHPEQVVGKGWAETGQHAASLDKLFYGDIVDRTRFSQRVSLQYVDMNQIDSRFDGQFDFAWSICAMEHLGSIDAGLRFVEESLRCVRPGGIVVHTTEYNYSDPDETIDHWETVLFQRKHFEQLRERLAARGHEMLRPDYDAGEGILDEFIDVPPFAPGRGYIDRSTWGQVQAAHLKLSVLGFPSTCFGIAVRRGA